MGNIHGGQNLPRLCHARRAFQKSRQLQFGFDRVLDFARLPIVLLGVFATRLRLGKMAERQIRRRAPRLCLGGFFQYFPRFLASACTVQELGERERRLHSRRVKLQGATERFHRHRRVFAGNRGAAQQLEGVGARASRSHHVPGLLAGLLDRAALQVELSQPQPGGMVLGVEFESARVGAECLARFFERVITFSDVGP